MYLLLEEKPFPKTQKTITTMTKYVFSSSRTMSVYFILYISIWVETVISDRSEIRLLTEDGLRPLRV